MKQFICDNSFLILLVLFLIWICVDYIIYSLRKKKKESGILNFIFSSFICNHLLKAEYYFPFSILLTLFLYFERDFDNNEIIYFITFLAIVWYGRETMVLRQATQNNNGRRGEKVKNNK